MEEAKVQRSIIKKYRKPIWNRFIGALKDYDMIAENDKIAVCISGGKDSFLLAKCMQELARHSEKPFELVFLCMDPGYLPENRAIIEQNAASLNIPLNIFETDIFNIVAAEETGSPCYLCARMRRGFLYKHAQALGCNKIALGHHFDDVVETVLMSMIYGAELKSMMPKLKSENYEGMELIRPLYLVRECDIISWKSYNSLHFLQCACRFTEMQEAEQQNGARKRIKQLVRELCQMHKPADINIFRATHSVHVGTMPGIVKNGKKQSFIDVYKPAIKKSEIIEEASTMDKIASFCVNHDTLTEGMYTSRIDGDITTYDIRMVKPNGGEYLSNDAMHTFEHLFATYARNSEWSEQIIYVGPMGCRTGFYLLVREVSAEDAIKLVQQVCDFVADFSGEIPGTASSAECGNYKEHSLYGAKQIALKMQKLLQGLTAEQLKY